MPNVVCPRCDRGFSPSRFGDHLEQAHQGSPVRVCDCAEGFVRSLNHALGNEQPDDLRLHVEALRDTYALAVRATS